MNSKAPSEDKTRKAIKSCAKWLHYCLTIGWDKSQLDALEKIWWDHHDEKGNLKPNASQFKSKDNIPSLSENFKKFSLMDEAPTIASDKTVLNIPEPDSQKEDVDKMFNEWIGNPAVDNQEELWADVLKTLGFFPSPRYLIEVKEKFHISRKPYNPE